MATRGSIFKHRSVTERRGAAAVECALVAPLLVLIVMGAIDVGRFINVSQTVNDASREGARRATRDSVTNVSDIESAVKSYLAEAFPNLSDSQLESALTVTVRDSEGTEVADGDLNAIPTGDPVTVDVVFQYDSVRWVEGLSTIGGVSLEADTTMRRE